ncbi:MAG: RagB/SusD family nutrient uptake outer membrane protein [Chitinophagaceae bacterium]|nr:RagB/SusD family nutrient uptake outer membrane protein [Chitinophagaceae bacterium]
MRAIFQFILAGLLITGIGLSACNKDLNEKLYSDVYAGSYKYTDAYSATGVVYINLRDLLSHTNYLMMQETSSDELVQPANASGWDDGGIYKQIHFHTWTSLTPQVGNLWNSLYAGVLNANRVISLLRADKIPLPSGVSKASLIGEMRSARAFYYWLICDNYGDAPLDTSVSTELPPATPRKDIYNFIVKEITEVLPDLSEDNNPLMYGRFNKWGAKALLANVYLNAKVYAGEDKWTDALTQCNDIISSGKYAPEANFRDIFKPDNEKSVETIFAIPFDQNKGNGNFIEMYSWHAALKAKVNMLATPWGSGSAMAVSQHIDTYDPDDERLKDNWLMGPQFALDGVTPLVGSYDQAGKPLVFTKDLPNGSYTGEAEGYRMNKFQVQVGAMANLNNDFPFFRYADVLLMKAECLLRTNDPDQAAQIVSQLRARYFKTMPAKAAVTGAQLLQNSKYKYGYVENYVITDPGNTEQVQYGGMLDELGWEFPWEGHRRRDMIRFGIYTKKSWLSHKPNGDYRTVFPIPQTTINSNPNLTQNPNYK